MALLWPNHGPGMAKTWVLYGPNNLILKGCFFLACMILQGKVEAFQASRSKYIVEKAKTWPYYDPNMAQTWLKYGCNNLAWIGILLFGLHDSTVKI